MVAMRTEVISSLRCDLVTAGNKNTRHDLLQAILQIAYLSGQVESDPSYTFNPGYGSGEQVPTKNKMKA